MKSLQVIQQSHTRAGEVLPSAAHAIGLDFDNDEVLVALQNTLYRYSDDCRDVSRGAMSYRLPSSR